MNCWRSDYTVYGNTMGPGCMGGLSLLAVAGQENPKKDKATLIKGAGNHTERNVK